MGFVRSLQIILNHPLNKNHKLKALFKLFWWKVNQILFKLPVVVELVPGIKCICYPESSFGSQIIYTKFPEYYEMDFVQWVLKPTDTFVDVGAGLGDYSLIAASRIKTGIIFAFEPHLVALAYLNENIAINNLQNKILAFNKVVSDKNGFEEFTSDEISEFSHISSKEDMNRIKIPSITLDNFFMSRKEKQIKIVKIDVEGAELKVLYGANNLLKKNAIDYLIIEINQRSPLYSGNADKVFSFLKKNGYIVFIFNYSSKLSPMDKKNKESRKVYNILAARKSKTVIQQINDYISN